VFQSFLREKRQGMPGDNKLKTAHDGMSGTACSQAAEQRDGEGSPCGLAVHACSLLTPDDCSAIDEIRPAWDALLSSTCNPYALYQSPDWWDHMVDTGEADAPALAVGYEDRGKVAAILPIAKVTRAFEFVMLPRVTLRYPLHGFQLLGSDPLAHPDINLQLSLLSFLGRSYPDAKALYIKCLPANGLLWHHLRTRGCTDWLPYAEHGIGKLQGIMLPRSFEEYTSKFAAKKRYNLKRQVRLLEEYGSGKLKLVRVESPEQVLGFVRSAQAVSRLSWQFHQGSPQFINGENRVLELKDLAQRGILRSYLLVCGEKPCTFVVGYQYRGIYHYADVAFDEHYARFSPGSVLLYLLIADLIETRRPTYVNLGIGDAFYKAQFANNDTDYVSLLLLRKTIASRILITAHATHHRIGVGIKSVVQRNLTGVDDASRKRPSSGNEGARGKESERAKRTRILFLIDQLGLAGTETHALRLAGNLSASHFDCRIGVLASNEFQRSLKVTMPIIDFGNGHLRPSPSIGNILRVARYIRREKIDILQAYFFDSELVAAAATRLCRPRPRFLVTRRNNYHWIQEYPHQLKIIRHTARMADQVLVNSRSVMANCELHEGLSASRIKVIYNGIDIGKYSGRNVEQAKKILGLDGQYPIIGVVASSRPEKGVREFVEAAAHVAAAHPTAVFVHVGFGLLDKEMRERAGELGLSARMVFLGSRDDVPEILPAFDVAVLPSQSEGFSNALLEYMAAGRAIVATEVGDAAIVITSGTNGFLVPPKDPRTLADRIIELCDDPVLAREFGKRAGEAVERWSLPAILLQYERFYDQLLAGKPGSPVCVEVD